MSSVVKHFFVWLRPKSALVNRDSEGIPERRRMPTFPGSPAEECVLQHATRFSAEIPENFVGNASQAAGTFQEYLGVPALAMFSENLLRVAVKRTNGPRISDAGLFGKNYKL